MQDASRKPRRCNPGTTRRFLPRTIALQLSKVGRDSHTMSLNHCHLHLPSPIVPLGRSFVFHGLRFWSLDYIGHSNRRFFLSFRLNNYSVVIIADHTKAWDNLPQSQPTRNSLRSGKRTPKDRYWSRHHNGTAAST